MPIIAHRPARTMLLAAAAFAAGVVSAPALAAGPAPSSTWSDADSVLAEATDLIGVGRAVKAHRILNEIARVPGLELSDDQQRRVSHLMSKASNAIASGDRYEIALQKAELWFETDDLLLAEQKTRSVGTSNEASDEQRLRAASILRSVEARRVALAALAPTAVDRAVDAFEAGNLGKAKSEMDRIARLGVTLDRVRQDRLDAYRARIVELEIARGEAFPASLTVLGPVRSDWLVSSSEEAGAKGAGRPAQPPAGEPTQQRNAFEARNLLGEADKAFRERRLGEAQAKYEQLLAEYSSFLTADEVTEITNRRDQLVSGQGTAAANVQPAEQPVEEPAAEATDQPPAVDPIEQSNAIEARNLLGEADTAYRERRLDEAKRKYDRLLANFRPYLTEGEISEITLRRDSAQVDLGNPGGGPDQPLLDEVEQGRELRRQQVEATFRNRLEQSATALATGDSTRARNLLAQARLEVSSARSVLSQPRYEQMISTIDNEAISVDQAERQRRIDEAESQARELERQAQRDTVARLEERDRKIDESIYRVRALQQEMRYEEALEVVDQILFYDATNPVGLLLKDVIEDSIIYRNYNQADKAQSKEYAYIFSENKRAVVPTRELIEYPEDWPSISLQRGQPLQFADDPNNRRVMAALDERSLPIDFNEVPIVDVVNFIQTTAQLDVDTDWTSLEDIGVDRDTPVTLRLSSGVALSTVLDRVLASVSDPDLPAAWEVIDGILVIASEEVLRRNTTLEIYDIRDLLFEVPNFDTAPEFDLQSSSGGSGGGQSPFQGGGGDDEDRIPREERVQQVLDVIQNNIDQDGWIELGGSTGSVQELNGSLIITQTPKSHRQIVGLLDQLREVRSVQINVEARFLLVSQDFFEQIGFDLDVYFNSNNMSRIAQSIDPSLTLEDFFDESTGDFLPRVGSGNFDIDGDGAFENTAPGGDYVPVFAPNTVGDEWSVMRAAQNSFGLTELLTGAASGFGNTILNTQPALGITGRFLDDIQVDFLVEATQADSRSVTLTAPRLTFTNGQRAWIAVTKDSAYVADLQPVVSDSSAAFDPQIQIAQDGVVIDIEGVVSADRRYVTLTVITGLSKVSFDESVTLEAVAGGTGGSQGGGIAQGTIQTPVADQTTIRTTVTIPDQGTILLGGQRLVSEVEVESGVPVLSKIPILSRFFSNRIDVKEEKTLLILIRPTVLIQNEQEEKNFPGLLDQLGL